MPIYIKDGDRLIEMTEQRYDAESVLQRLLADHPNLLVGGRDGEPRKRWLLVQAEMSIGEDRNGGGRWSLDHLFLDDAGIPTLVEVKRSTDTRIRREVVGQLLDYAANAPAYWGLERIRAAFESHHVGRGVDPEAVLTEHLGSDLEPDAFWANVGTNLSAGRLRLVFVADAIPAELRRIIEFLNEQMARTDVLGVEVKQYRAPDSELITLVPHLIGNTEAARATKLGGGSAAITNRTALMTALAEVDAAAARAATAFLEWADDHPGLSINWTRAGDIIPANGGRSVFRIWPEGTLEFKVIGLRQAAAAWDDDERIERLLQRLERIDGVEFTRNRRLWPRTPLAPLADADRRHAFLAVIAEVLPVLDIEA